MSTITKLVPTLKNLFNKYTFLSPVLALGLTCIVLWLNSQYVLKNEMEAHQQSDKTIVAEIIKNKDAAHREFINLIIEKDKIVQEKLDVIIVNQGVTSTKLDFQGSMINMHDSRLLFLERQKRN